MSKKKQKANTPQADDKAGVSAHSGWPRMLQRTLLVLVTVFYISVFFPGLLDLDSQRILFQGINPGIPRDNLYAPLLTVMFGVIFRIFQNIGFIWCIVAFSYLYGAYRVAQLCGSMFVVCFLGLTFCPPILFLLEKLLASTWCLTFFLYAVLFTFLAFREYRRLWVFLAALFSALAATTRVDYNIPAVILIAGLCVMTHRTVAGPSRMARCKKTLFPVLVFLLGWVVFYWPASLTVKHKLHTQTTFMVWDIVGANYFAGTESFDLCSHRISMKDVGPHYNGYGSDVFTWGKQSIIPGKNFYHWDADDARCIKEAWLRTIKTHPSALIRHKMNVAGKIWASSFASYWHPRPLYDATWLPKNADPKQVTQLPTPRREWLGSLQGTLDSRYFWDIRTYLCMALASLVVIRYRRKRETWFGIMLFLSSLLFMIALTFTVPSVRFVYFIWCVPVAVILFSLALDALWRSPGRGEDETGAAGNAKANG